MEAMNENTNIYDEQSLIDSGHALAALADKLVGGLMDKGTVPQGLLTIKADDDCITRFEKACTNLIRLADYMPDRPPQTRGQKKATLSKGRPASEASERKPVNVAKDGLTLTERARAAKANL